MANFSNQTRKQQVYYYLLERENEWVDGPEIANERVGGSEGLKRLRELRVELEDTSYGIELRGHPDPDRDIFQYRIVRRPDPPESYTGPAPAVTHASVEPPTQERPRESLNAPARRSDTHLAYDPVTDTYIAVYDGPVPEVDPPPLPGQLDMGVPEVEGHKYTSKPAKLELGKSISCPLCHGIHRAIKEKDPVTGKAAKRGKIIGYEELTRNPHKASETCPRCNGFGLIPAS